MNFEPLSVLLFERQDNIWVSWTQTFDVFEGGLDDAGAFPRKFYHESLFKSNHDSVEQSLLRKETPEEGNSHGGDDAVDEDLDSMTRV